MKKFQIKFPLRKLLFEFDAKLNSLRLSSGSVMNLKAKGFMMAMKVYIFVLFYF